MAPPGGRRGRLRRRLRVEDASLPNMRTQALRLTIGAYSDGTWHVATIADHYERGVLVHSEIEDLSHPENTQQLEWNVKLALRRLVVREAERVRTETAAGTQAIPAAVPASEAQQSGLPEVPLSVPGQSR